MTDPTTDPVGFAGLLLKAAESKQWWLLLSLVLMGAVMAIRYFVPKKWPESAAAKFLATSIGSLALVFLCSLFGAMVTALSSGQGVMTGALALSALKIAAGAVLAFETGKAGVKAASDPTGAVVPK